jgi:hypothetical protein
LGKQTSAAGFLSLVSTTCISPTPPPPPYVAVHRHVETYDPHEPDSIPLSHQQPTHGHESLCACEGQVSVCARVSPTTGATSHAAEDVEGVVARMPRGCLLGPRNSSSSSLSTATAHCLEGVAVWGTRQRPMAIHHPRYPVKVIDFRVLHRV